VNREPILGIGVDAIGPDRATAILIEAAKDHRPLSATALAVHGLMTGWREPEFRNVLSRMGLVLADGQPVRWALNWLFSADLAERVYGPGLMIDLCEAAAAGGIPVFLYGSTDEVLDGLTRNLTNLFPDLEIAGVSPSAFGPLDRAAQEEVAGRIGESGARLCFVGTGCPRQEMFAERIAPMVGTPVVAVGAAFDFHAGSKAMAPGWMQAAGLEWLFRLSREPRRLWRRYLTLNPAYLLLLLGQRLGLPVSRKSSENRSPDSSTGPIPG
jgi:exopolysaccharide biosynthesis WecB/TagA/CpsF family protein